jgi:hypothetical protein
MAVKIHHPVEASETRVTTALVSLQLHSSLYTGTVHVLSSVAEVHPTGLTADQGCRQVSTIPKKESLAAESVV